MVRRRSVPNGGDCMGPPQDVAAVLLHYASDAHCDIQILVYEFGVIECFGIPVRCSKLLLEGTKYLLYVRSL